MKLYRNMTINKNTIEKGSIIVKSIDTIYIATDYNYFDNTIVINTYNGTEKEEELYDLNYILKYKNSFPEELILGLLSLYFEAKSIEKNIINNGLKNYYKYIKKFWIDDNDEVHFELKINSIIFEVIQNSYDSNSEVITDNSSLNSIINNEEETTTVDDDYDYFDNDSECNDNCKNCTNKDICNIYSVEEDE